MNSVRDLRFLKTLKATLSVHLPETSKPFPETYRWRTFRLRPEIAQAVEALQDRYAAHRGGLELTPSEIIAAALNEALPIMTARGDFQR